MGEGFSHQLLKAAFPAQRGGQATQGLIPDILQEAEKQGMWYTDARGACFKQQAPDPSKLTQRAQNQMSELGERTKKEGFS